MTGPSTIETLPFSLEDDIPIGQTMLIEASAGTGKTYTLAALTTRLVAEHDIEISQILLATFNTAAADELRERIRAALKEAESHLADPTPGAAPILDLLADVDDAERALRRGRLTRAVREFDKSRISTIHGFCSAVLETQGALSEFGSGTPAELLTEGELINQVSSDLLFAEANRLDPDSGTNLPTLTALRAAIEAARNLGAGQIIAESDRQVDLLLAELTKRSVAEIDARLRRKNSMSFTSMISSVRDLVGSDPQLVSELRQRFRVALIDEFQDTDPYQWDIFKSIFADGDPRLTLIMVGDPKQAIYAFRGGDVYAYLEARKGLVPRVLGTNHRSIPRVVKSMNLIGAGHYFGEAEIAYQQVEPSERNSKLSLALSDGQVGGSTRVAPGIEVRCLNPEKSLKTKDANPATEVLRVRVLADLADKAVELLHGASLVSSGPSGNQVKPLKPSDIAVLVATGDIAQTVAAELRRRGVPSVKLMNDSVLKSAAAKQWLILLRAIERPSKQALVAAAAVSWFFGWSADSLASAVAQDPARTDENPDLARLVEMQYQLSKWAQILEASGVSALFAEIRRVSNVIPHLLSDADGERNITDLEHIAELLHRESGGRSRGVSPAQVVEVLESLMAEEGDKADAADHLQRRVESDADAVQIMTIHRAKGLEFPVVLLADLWSAGRNVELFGPFSYYDRERHMRILDVSTNRDSGPEGKAKSKAQLAPKAAEQTRSQKIGDQHRLTYVALTRASHLTVVWWAAAKQKHSDLTGIARLLFGVDDNTGPGQAVKLPEAADTVERLRERFNSLGAGDVIRVAEIPAPDAYPVPYDPGLLTSSEFGDIPGATSTAPMSSGLAVAKLSRRLERSGFRWSFSSLKDNVRQSGGERSTDESDHDGHPGTDPTVENSDDRGAGDESDGPLVVVSPVAESEGDWSAPTLWDGLGAGADFGTMVHELYEAVDFTDPDPETAFRDELATQRRFAVTPEQFERLPQALAATLVTPLGESFGGLRLADVSASDRLNELNFYIPVAPSGVIAASNIGEVVNAHLEPGHPLRGWADRLSAGLHHIDLTGYLSGAIDLIFRYEVDGRHRYSVLDYKTNRLSGPDGSSLADYHPDRLVHAMDHTHYALQALIYSVALHRYLRLRVPDYQPETDLGPVAYTFVRGMAGKSTPVVGSGFWKGSSAGVFAWYVPPSLIVDLSDSFDADGGTPV